MGVNKYMPATGTTKVPISFMFLDPYLAVSYFTFEMVVWN